MQQPETHPTPEERAAEALPCLCAQIDKPGSHLSHHFDCPARRRDAVAAAIRSASDAARADEREACAKVAGDQAEEDKRLMASGEIPRSEASIAILTAREIQGAIRARSTSTTEGR